MSATKKIVVFTVTGDQGSSVARYLLKDGKYSVVGITRNPEGETAKQLASEGVELFKGDLTDPSTYKDALKGVYGAFVNTDFWVHYFANNFDGDDAAEKEIKEARGAIQSLVDAGVKHIVFSTLDDVDYIPHSWSKAKVSTWAREQKFPVTHLFTSAYFRNVSKFGQLIKKEDGTFLLNAPIPDDGFFPMYASEQTGGWVLAALNDPETYIGKEIQAVSSAGTVKDFANVISQVIGKPVATLGIDRETFVNHPEKFNQVPELYLNLLAYSSGHVPRDVEQSKAVYPDQWDAKAWAAQSKELKAIIA